LRQEIDSLRRERVVFDQLYKKMEKELSKKKNRMAEIIETANAAYEQRDTANETLGKEIIFYYFVKIFLFLIFLIFVINSCYDYFLN
jgi:hypothetical protein